MATTENKKKSPIELAHDIVKALIPTTQLKGAIAPKTGKDGLYGIVFRNVDWIKLKSKQPEINKLLKDVDWNFTMALSREDDPMSMATGKNGMPLMNSFAYLGKDFREIADIDFSEIQL